MRAVDTNVLVRLFVADDPKQTERATNFVKGGAWLSHLVLVETIWVLASYYSLDRDRQIQAVEMLLSNTALTIQDEDTVTEALSLFRRHRGVNFSDCLIISTARKHGHTPLGTFDAKLGRVEGAQKI